MLKETDEKIRTELDLAEHVQRMLQSPHLARAETQRKLLAYLWENRHDTVSEYAIATEALGRHSSFDSTTDASVRVHISRLRKKLKDYYRLEPAEPELLAIPTGTHQLMVLEPSAAAPIVDVDPPTFTDWFAEHRLLLTACLCGCLLLIVGLLGVRVATLRQRLADRPEANSFFQSFLEGKAPIKIILPTPVFFNFPDVPTLKIRSTDVNEFKDFESSEQIQGFVRRFGQPGLDQSYTVTYDTLAVIDMVRYLDSLGQNSRVSVDVTRDSPTTVFEKSNVIIFGTHATLQPMHEYLAMLNFTLAAKEEWVQNAHPEKGELPRYELQHEGKERQIEPSIVAVLPGRVPGVKVLLVQSRKSVALVSFLTSASGSSSMEEMWKQHGSPKFYEVVVLTETQGNNAIRTRPVALHAYTGKAPANAM